MGEHLRVSVVVPAYNSADFVREAVESALDQTLPAIEVIVVDDGSTDDTAKVLKSLEGRIQLIHQANAGVAAARNTGIRAARGELIAFLDADDVWLPTRLERQIRRHQQDESLGLTHCGLIEVDQDTRPLRNRLDGLAGEDVAQTMLWGQGHRLHAIGSTMIVTRAAIEEVGGFDVDVPPSEDWELMYRIARRFRIGFVAEPLVLYRQHPKNAHRNIPRQERSMILALERVFQAGDADVAALRRRSYATVHGWLAGCYWEVGERGKALRHAAVSTWLHPPMLRYFMAYPIRRISRLTGDQSSVSFALPDRRAIAQAHSVRLANLVHSEAAKQWYFTSLTTAGLPRLLLRRAVRQRSLLVMNLHSVSDSDNPFWPAITPDEFESLVRFLAQNCAVTTFERILQTAADTDRPLAVLSFDDGYLDFVEAAMPIMGRYGIAANLNLIGECVETGRPPWIVRVVDELNAVPVSRLQRIAIPGAPAWSARDAAGSKQRFGAQLTNYLKSFPREQGEQMWSEAKQALGEVEFGEPRRMMRAAEIRAATAAGHEIGVHSYSHESMELMDDEAFVADLRRAQDVVKQSGGGATVYAFPNGSYRPEQIPLAQQCGMRHVLLVGERPSRIGSHVHTRLTVRGYRSEEIVLRALGHRPPLLG